MAIANLAMATGNIGRPGVGVNPLARPEQRAGLLRHGLVPARAARLSPHLRGCDARDLRDAVGQAARPRAGPAHPQHARRRGRRLVQGPLHPGRGHPPVRPRHPPCRRGLAAMECVVVQDLFLNETANYAHVFLPGSTFLEKDGTFTNAERRIQLVRKVMAPRVRHGGLGDHAGARQGAWAIRCSYAHPSEIMDEIARLTPTFAGVSFDKLDRLGSHAMAVQRQGARGHAGHARRRLRARQGPFRHHRIRADRREHRPALPAAAHHRPHPIAIQCRRPDAAHRQHGLARGGPPRDPSRTTPKSAASATATG